MIFAKPNPTRSVEGVPTKVRDYQTRGWVPVEGQLVDEADLYWARRLMDGDLVLAAPLAAPVQGD